MIDGVRVPVESRYVLGRTTAERSLRVRASGSYRRDRELVIDPGVEYTTFLGGASHEIGAGIAVDAAGNAYVVGTTQSPDFPTTPGAFRRTGAAGNFSATSSSRKLNADRHGARLLDVHRRQRLRFRTPDRDRRGGQRLRHRPDEVVELSDHRRRLRPHLQHPQLPALRHRQYDAFVTKLNAAGSALVYSTFLGGTDIDDARGIAVDGAGNAYVTGETLSRDFPTTAGAFGRTSNGAVRRLRHQAERRRLGARLLHVPRRHAGRQRRAHRRRRERERLRHGLHQLHRLPDHRRRLRHARANGAFDVFVTKLNAAGSALVYSTYLGGQGFDSGGGLAVDAAGDALTCRAATGSLDFPTTAGAFDTVADGSDAFVTKLNAAGSALVYSTVLGGTGGDGANGVAVDAARQCLADRRHELGGLSDDRRTRSTASFNGVADAFVSRVERRTVRRSLYSTYLGGSQSDVGNDLAVDDGGDVYVTGHTYSLDFPGDGRRVRHDLQRRPVDLLGRRVRRRRLRRHATRRRRRRRRRCRRRRPCCRRPTATRRRSRSRFDWSDVAERGVVHDPDRRLERLHRAARARTDASPTSMYATSEPGDQAALLAGSRREFGRAWPAPGRRCAASRRRPRRRRRRCRRSTTNPSTVVGGNASSGTVGPRASARPKAARSIALSSSHPAVASVPATATAPANQLHRDVHDRDVRRSRRRTDGHHHRDLQRHDAERRRSRSRRRRPRRRRRACRAWC